MERIELKLNKTGHGYFILTEDEEQLGEMEVSITKDQMTVFHTEVIPPAEGRGLASKLLNEMVEYARKNNLKVNVLCPYVLARFKHEQEKYGDIWKNKIDGTRKTT
ncbi:MAG TPA: GNAT family N-acetyltransferase [Hanamia sp.]|nr:GNAT family N-acetyltransferase [Hanamia sp.]